MSRYEKCLRLKFNNKIYYILSVNTDTLFCVNDNISLLRLYCIHYVGKKQTK